MLTEAVNNVQGETFMSIGNLGDIPDLGGIIGETTPSWENGWYRATINASRSFTDKNGNDRLFESQDSVSAKGTSRNLKLQITVARKDGKTLNNSMLVNYNPDALAPETVAAVKAHVAEKKQTDRETLGELFLPFMTLQKLSNLQTIAGRTLTRTAEGGLDLSPLFGKTFYVRLKDDSRNPQYKEVDKFQAGEPRKVPVL